MRPDHLRPLLDAFERAETEPVRACVSVPPRHSKTVTVLHGLARYLLRHPTHNVGYISYASDLALEKSGLCQEIAMRAGVQVRQNTRALNAWRTVQGGTFFATGVGGPLTGRGVNLLVIDDPHKNRQEAESPSIRRRIYEWYSSVANTRIEPGGSLLVVHTRWHPDDLIGQILRGPDASSWNYICLAALAEEGDPLGRPPGTPLWPERWPLEELLKKKAVNEYDWASLYQGRPVPRGNAVFRDAYYYDRLPSQGYRLAIGIDLAYSQKSYSDWSVLVVVARQGDTTYIVDVVRLQTTSERFGALVAQYNQTYGCPAYWHGAGSERGIRDYMVRTQGAKVTLLPFTGDKFVRAQEPAAAWNQGKVLLPKNKTWVDPFLSELLSFTGVQDAHDDQVDAFVSAFLALNQRPANAFYLD